MKERNYEYKDINTKFLCIDHLYQRDPDGQRINIEAQAKADVLDYSKQIYNSFDVVLYKTKIYYFFTPKQLPHFWLLYVVIGIGTSLLISYIVNRFKDSIKSKYKIVKK